MLAPGAPWRHARVLLNADHLHPSPIWTIPPVAAAIAGTTAGAVGNYADAGHRHREHTGQPGCAARLPGLPDLVESEQPAQGLWR
ncbi:hypothetical protein ACU4GD_15795 [Cupriavidus basilensis]